LKAASLTVIALLALLPTVSAAPPVYRDTHAPLEARVGDLMARLTPREKMSLLSGTAFTTTPIPRLGVPAMGMADAGQGVRGGMAGTLGPATLFPSGVAMASTWDPALVGRIGAAIGEEALNKGTGTQILLGPAVNIQRSPLGGRNGEYFSEDPYLAGRLGVGYIRGMQGAGCGACLKHFACNNEEVDRGEVNVHVDERTLREIYLPAFEMGVKEGHAWTVMSSYNRVNGPHSSASDYLLTQILKKGWGWDGMVMSDWGGVHTTARSVAAGNDLEMPGPGYLAPDKVALALAQGAVTQAEIDDNARRVLRAVLRTGLLDGPHVPDHGLVNSPAHQRLTFEAASQSIVLLKNAGGLLPLDTARVHSIAVIGQVATAMQYGAAGSPGVQPFYAISPLDGIKARAGTATRVVYVRGTEEGTPIPQSALRMVSDGGGPGLRAEYFAGRDFAGRDFAGRDFAGKPAAVRTDPQIQFDWDGPPAPGLAHTDFSVRWTGRLVAPVTGRYALTFAADDGCRLFLDGKTLIDHWIESDGAPVSVAVDLVAGRAYDLRAEYFQAAGKAFARLDWTLPGTTRFQEAADAARRADVAVVCAGTLGTEGEGQDRPSMDLPQDQDALIAAVAAANPRTVVVLNNGTPCRMTGWLDRVPALVEAWFPGQEGGRALAAVLFGDVNPSGKLPTTLAARREDYPDAGHFPGVNNQVDYAEGIYVGYRHFDKAKVAPLFPFGFGLSYTTFRYGPLRLADPALTPGHTATATIDVTNTGSRAGAEVVELYVHDPAPKIDKPLRELKGFGKVALEAGETETVTFTLPPRAFAYCDVPGKRWKADAGVYDIEAGASSRDIRQTAALRLSADYLEPIPFLGDVVSRRDPGDLALGRPVTASSVEKDGLGPENAVDGDADSRWASGFSDPQWIAVDLGAVKTVGSVRLDWEAASATSYDLQVSPDGKAWATVYHTEKSIGGLERVTLTPVKTRWVRVLGLKRATQFGYSLYSLGVYGPGAGKKPGR